MNFMKEESYIDSGEIAEMPDEPGSEIMDMLEHIRQHLTFLEKKLDMLINRTERERPFDGARQAPKPFRRPYEKPPQSQRFDRPPRRDRNDGEDRERDYRERDYRDRESSREHHFDRRKTGKKPGGKPRPGQRPSFGKKPFHSRYSDK